MVAPVFSDDNIQKLRKMPKFAVYARDQIATRKEFWQHQAKFGSGLFQVYAGAVVAVGDDAP